MFEVVEYYQYPEGTEGGDKFERPPFTVRFRADRLGKMLLGSTC